MSTARRRAGLAAAALLALPLSALTIAPAQAAEEPSSVPADPFEALWQVAWNDYDLDGVPNDLEFEAGGDPTDADTNYNRLSDGYEFFGGPHRNPEWTSLVNYRDSDNDHALEASEHAFCTNAMDGDMDRDGFSDYVELFASHTLATVADSDGDGVSDHEEAYRDFTDFHTGTIIEADGTVREVRAPDSETDTDEDGLPDYYETIDCATDPHATGPTRSDPAQSDTDGDGLNDRTELGQGTDPWKRDTDADGLTDDVEGFYLIEVPEWVEVIDGWVRFFADPNDPDQNRNGIPDGIDFGNLQLDR